VTRLALTLAAVLAIAAGPAQATAPELMERAVLPTTGALPTCACAVPVREGHQLVVGLANGDIVSFHETGGSVIPRVAHLPGSGPVDDIIACRVGRAAGSPNEFALLAVRGSSLFCIGFSDMAVARRVSLPDPSGTYGLAKATHRTDGVANDYTTTADYPVLFDDDSALGVTLEAGSLTPRVEAVLEGVPGLVVTALSDRVIAVAGPRSVTFLADGGAVPHIDERTDLADEPARIALRGRPEGTRTLELQVAHAESVLVTRTVAAPGIINSTVSVADTVMAMGGTMPLTPSHDIGWVALVDPNGRKVAVTDHASPVANIEPVSGFLAVQGEDRNLSFYDMELRPLWDHDSPVTDVTLVAGNFAGGEAEGLAVVGTRTFRVSTANADSIRACLDLPGFMGEAERTSWGYSLPRSFITVCVSNEDRLRRALEDCHRAADDAFDAGDFESAASFATDARAAAAVLGERDEVARLSSEIRRYSSLGDRRSSLLLSSLILAALGVWAAVECVRGSVRPALCVAAALLLVAAGVWSWRMLGDTGWSGALFAGGAVASLFIVRRRIAPGPARQVSGAAIEDLIRAIMEFLHGAGEGVPSEGVVDAARKSVTKVAYLAQEMVDSLDDKERYDMLKERLDARGSDFLDTTYPRVAVVLSLARRAGFVVAEAEQMARAADRMRAAITTILEGATPASPVLKQQLQAIKDGRDRLAEAADRAWAIIQSNPGCSLTRSIDSIRMEKTDEIAEAAVHLELRQGVPAEHDAVALWSFEFRFILENLMTNALRAMRDSTTRKLTIETATDGAVCSVRITDTGTGMDDETAKTLFNSKGEERDGGFGMPNTRLRLRERGGNIAIERTALGEGTVLLLTIPHWTPTNGDNDV
jgi:signal transduction histidine kinase